MGVMKTRYCVFEPTPISPEQTDADKLALLDAPTWIEVEIPTEPRKLDHGPEAPEDVPAYRGVKAILQTLFVPPRQPEHVSVQGGTGAGMDMFVDDCGYLDSHPVNEAATIVYWTASIMHEMYASAPIDAKPSFEELFELAREEAADRLTANPERADTPRIHGRAVLFDGKVWF